MSDRKPLERILSVIIVFAVLFLGGCGGDDDTGTNPDNPSLPVLTTATVSAITQTTAQCGGTISSDGGSAVTARGVCWSTNSSPAVADSKTTDGTGTGSFTSGITGLSAGTNYYVRAYATNGVGTGYGNIQSFSTEAPATVTDIDGNNYNTVTIGSQVWMVENLKVTHYRNGDLIPNVTDSTIWSNLTSGAYCNYDNDEGNVPAYGHLYNWYAVADSRNIAPEGWHVPTDYEWNVLANYLGGADVAGGKLKEADTTHWISPNDDANNESGFSALPGGYRNDDNNFMKMRFEAWYWASTQYLSTGSAWYRYMNCVGSYIDRRVIFKRFGLSVRCVKDQ